MSHFTVLVIGPEDKVEAQLAPYHEFECTGEDNQYVQDIDITQRVLEQATSEEGDFDLQDGLGYFGLENRQVTDEKDIDKETTHKYGYAVVRDNKLIKAVQRTNPNAKWNWYSVGGRWGGFFLLKDGERADAAAKKDIDITAMCKEIERRARQFYRRLEEIIGDSITTFVSWKELRDSEALKDDINAARKVYHEQDAVKKLNSLGMEFFNCDPEILRQSEDDYAELEVAKAMMTFAVVKDGIWHERGNMGWWGCVSEEKETNTWVDEFWKLINGTADDELFTLVDCHI